MSERTITALAANNAKKLHQLAPSDDRAELTPHLIFAIIKIIIPALIF